MANEKIRLALTANSVRHWQLADALGISEYTLCRKLRKELASEKQEEIIKLIETIKEAHSNENL